MSDSGINLYKHMLHCAKMAEADEIAAQPDERCTDGAVFGIPEWLIRGLEIDTKKMAVQEIKIHATNQTFMEVIVRYIDAGGAK